MMISWIYILIFYFFSIFMFFNFSNSIIFWIMMEINLISFILVLNVDKTMTIKKDSVNYLIYYFLIQSSASILFLSNFFFGDWGSIFNMSDMFLISMVLKIGLFPLFFWIFNIGNSLGWLSLLLLLTFQKIPLFSMLFCSFSFTIYVVLFSSFIVGSIFLFFSTKFSHMVISSSVSYSFLFYFSFTYSIKFFLLFFFAYVLFLGCLIKVFYFKCSMSGFFFVLSSFFLGLPPLSLFFFKYIICSELFLNLSFMEICLFWFFGIVGLVGYLKFFYQSFFYNCSLYLNNEFWFKKTSLIFCVSIIFLFFFC